MGKIDDMRRQREEQFDRQQRRSKARADAPLVAPAAPAAPVAPVAPAPDAAPAARAATASAGKASAAKSPAAVSDKDVELAQPSRPTRPTATKKTTSSKSGGAVAEQGKCPVCKKMKPLANGVLAQHQKGFGKACAGSRRAPD